MVVLVVNEPAARVRRACGGGRYAFAGNGEEVSLTPFVDPQHGEAWIDGKRSAA